ncbi:MAG TPA: aminopeptidase [Bacteroidia bacterium]|nr:aminopeptidase [Bacteroidia bacterium]
MNKRNIIFIISAILLFSAIRYRELICYGINQLRGQLSIIINARDIDEVIKDKSVPDSIKYKLALIQEIKKFAVDSLGIKASKNYSTYYDQQGKPAIWVITATEPFAMRPFEWNFPFLGSLSYKGFFEKEKGLPELEELRKKGYDVDYGTAGGWSTLGWFKDPVLSGMLRKKEGRLAELIIHELTHGTIYISNNVEYNENLATFIGEEGAKQFINNKFGKESPQMKEYLDFQADEEIFGDYMITSCLRLDSLYNHLNLKDATEVNYRKKYFLIKDIILNINQLPLNNPERYRFKFPGDHLPNNSFFMSFKRYRKKQTDFRQELSKNGGNIKQWLLHLRSENN